MKTDTRIIWVRYILVVMFMGISINTFGQISTTVYNDREVKENSIIVKYDDKTISFKGKSITPQALAAEVKAEMNAVVSERLKFQNIEEWKIAGDLKSSLKKLNKIPGVRAFPNYVFHRQEMDPKFLSEEDSPFILNESTDAVNRNKVQLRSYSVNLSVAGLESYTPLPYIYEENFNDSAAVDSTWDFVDWLGSGINWQLVDDGNGGFMPKVSNTADTIKDIAADLYAPGIDMSGLDPEKSYRIKFDISNNYVADFIGLYFDTGHSGSGSLNITSYDNWGWWDISSFVGDTLYLDFYVEAYEVAVGQDVVSIDNIVIEEYPVNDPWIELQYALQNDGLFSSNSVEGADISAFDAWEQTTGSSDVVVVVFDDGVDFDHGDLSSRAWMNPGETPANGIDDDGNGYVDDIYGWSAVYGDNSYLNEGSFHGTHVAGIIGAEAKNAYGISGVAQDVTLISVMIFDEYGSTTALAIMEGYEYISSLLENGVEITAINQSWGGGAYLDYESDGQFVNVMTDYAMHHNEYGALWVVSAGNDASDRDGLPFYSYPNNIQSPNIITVASSDDADMLSGFSDFGIRTVDIAAPGSNIISTYPGDSFVYMSGTSMASPQVTGAIALAKSLYPDATGHELLARTLAGAEYVSNLDGYVAGGTRLNANSLLSPAAEGITDALVPSHETAYFHRTLLDAEAYSTIGFINNTASAVTVSGITLSNTDNFRVIGDFSSVEVAAGASFGVPVSFNNNGDFGEITGVATISTSAGNVEINLNGQEQGFPQIVVDPEYTEVGPVAHGSEFETTFNIINDGNTDLEFGLYQELYLLQPEEFEALAKAITFKPSGESVEKMPAGSPESFFEELTAKVMLNRGDRSIPKIKYEPGTHNTLNEHGAEVVFWDDFENADSVAYYWTVEQFGSGDVWELANFDIEGESNNVFLLGDLDFGYMNNTFSVATPPAFDFSNLEEGYGPAYLAFDVSVQMEEGYDNFYVNVISNGSLYETIVSTSNETIINHGGYYRVYVDITHLAGLSDVEFWFIGNTDGIVVDGFGALIDNVEIVVDELPYYTSVMDGVIAPGEQEEVTVTVKTNKLAPGDYYLYTDVFSNSALSYYSPFAPYNVIYFESRNVNLGINPQVQDAGEVDPEAPFNFSFDATNVGAADLEYFADVFITYDEGMEDEIAESFDASMDAALERFNNAPEKEQPAINLQKVMEQMLNNVTSRSPTVSSSPDSYHHRMTPSLQNTDVYFEDFESGELSEDWDVLDFSLGLGSVFEVENLGSESDPYHTLFVGEYHNGTSIIFDNTTTVAYSPIFDLSSIPNGEAVYLEFDYSFLLEEGYDIGYVAIFFGNEEEGYYGQMLGTSEDVFMNNGGQYRAQMNIDYAKGYEEVYLGMQVSSDWTVQSGWAYFDNIDVYTSENLAYLTPNSGTLTSGQTQTFEGTVNAHWLNPGNYLAISYVDYYSGEYFISRYGEQFTYFHLPNDPPVAQDDEIAVMVGDVIAWTALQEALLGNDSDDSENFWLYDISDPLYGSFKYRIEEDDYVYVAPANEGYDDFSYIISDGNARDTAKVTVSVHANPEFVNGSDKQYVFLEDESLTLSTIGMAAGVGGMDGDLIVWGESGNDNIDVSHDGLNHTITLSADEDFFGQGSATLHVGYADSDPMDSMDLSIVVVPVNDAPVAEFAAEVDKNTITFTDMSADPKDASDGGVVQWDWSFGDGNTSEDRNPVHVYDETGTYEVSLTVTDNGGLTHTFTSELTVSVTVSNEELEAPQEFALEQNYPNPFNPNTIIKYSIPEASQVSIVVYDLLGKKVAELVNSRKSAGNYTINFDASNLTSGLYIYQIRAGSYTNTKKMTLIK